MLYTIDSVRATLQPVFRKHNVKRAILFGSVGRGENDEHSDIDIMVDSGLKGLSFFGLLNDVCESFDCDVDLIDVQDIIPNSRVQKEIDRTGVVIYETA